MFVKRSRMPRARLSEEAGSDYESAAGTGSGASTGSAPAGFGVFHFRSLAQSFARLKHKTRPAARWAFSSPTAEVL